MQVIQVPLGRPRPFGVFWNGGDPCSLVFLVGPPTQMRQETPGDSFSHRNSERNPHLEQRGGSRAPLRFGGIFSVPLSGDGYVEELLVFAARRV